MTETPSAPYVATADAYTLWGATNAEPTSTHAATSLTAPKKPTSAGDARACRLASMTGCSMANDEFREDHEERRNHGLKARHETREARAVRKAVAEEIASEFEKLAKGVLNPESRYNEGFIHACGSLARLAREIGSRDPQ